MERWVSQSNLWKQAVLTAVCIGFGLALAVGFRDFDGPGMTNSKSGFLLGLGLLALGVMGAMALGRQTVVVDSAARRIEVEDKTLYGTKRRSIAFWEIAEVRVGFLGKRSNYVKCYYLVLKLRNGEEYPLFAPGRCYDGSSHRSVVESWRKRLERILRQ